MRLWDRIKNWRKPSKEELTSELASLALLTSDDVLCKDLIDSADNLIVQGADPDARASDGIPILFHTVMRGNNRLLKILLDNGANPNTKNSDGFSALLCSAINGNTESTRLLINAGANVNEKTKGGATPLLMAIEKGHSEIVKLLTHNGADIDSIAIRLAKDKLHTDIATHLEQGVVSTYHAQNETKRRLKLVEKSDNL